MKFPKINFRKALLIFLSISAIYIFGSIGLIFTAEPVFEPTPKMTNVDLASTGLNFQQNYKYTEKYFKTRDGINLYANSFEVKSNTTILFLHGILASNFQFNTTAGLLSTETNTNVITLDLRGHGKSEGKPGDIDYIDQYVDDISDVVETIRKQDVQQRIILAGHSMGGGIAMRYVMKKNTSPIDGYLLFAPALGWEAPTSRKETNSEDEKFSQAHVPRIIGNAMLNAIGITSFNNKPVLFFNFQNGSPIIKYTYRSMASMSPDNASMAFKKVNKPLLVIVGKDDQVFYADKFESLVTENSKGKVYLIDKTNHNSVHYNAQSIAIVKDWLNK
jgi:alpha-beta hydrolase superfamily lysophospholipase